VTLFEGVKFAHVVSAIVAVGTNLTYGLIMARSANQPEHERFALGVVKTLDRSLANPAYGLLLVTGIWMVLRVKGRRRPRIGRWRTAPGRWASGSPSSS